VLLVLWAIRIKAAWFTPRPEVILRQDIVSAEKRYIYRHLILHYAEATIANSWVSEDKARRLSRAQVCLLAAFVLAVLMGLSRAIFSVPDKPSSPAALPSATSTD